MERQAAVKGIWRMATSSHSVDHCEVTADDAAAVEIYNRMVMQNACS